MAQKQPNAIGSLFIQSLNQLIDLHSTRADNVLYKRLPPMLLATLTFLALLGITLMGYLLGRASRRQMFTTMVLFVAYATVFDLVIDLDRPTGGFFIISNEPMIELHESMRATVGR